MNFLKFKMKNKFLTKFRTKIVFYSVCLFSLIFEFVPYGTIIFKIQMYRRRQCDMPKQRDAT